MKAFVKSLFILYSSLVFSQNSLSIPHDVISLNPVEKELKQQWVSSMLQDSDGFIWVSTQDGLYKYYGKNTKAYRYNTHDKKSLPANWVRSMVQDANGMFWLGTQGEGLVAFNQKTETFEKVSIMGDKNTPNGLIVYNLFLTSNGALWIQSDDGLYRKSNNNTIVKVSTEILNTYVNETDDGQEVVILDNTIYKYHASDNSLEKLLQKQDIRKLTHTVGDNFLLKCENTLFTYKLGSEPELLKTPETIYGISNTRNNSCVLVGLKSIYKYHIVDKTFQKLENNLEARVFKSVSVLFLDRQDMLWFGTYNGLYKENIGGSIFKSTIPVHARRIISFGDQLIIAGNQGLYKYTLQSQKLETLIDSVRVFSVLKTNTGIWAGDMQGNLYFLDKQFHVKTFKLIENTDKLLKIYGIVQDKNGYLWVSSWEGLHLVNTNGEVLKTYTIKTNNKKNELKALQIHMDTHDNLWVITVGNGIYKIPHISEFGKNKKELQYQQFSGEPNIEDGLNVDTLYEIYEANENQLWFGTDSGISIYNFNTNTFNSFKIDYDVFDKKTMAINADASGLIWISTIRNGLYVYNAKKNRLLNLNTQDGLVSDACLFTSSLFYKDRLYFGTERGVQVIDSKAFTFPEITSRPVISTLDLYATTQENADENSYSQRNIKDLDHVELNSKQTDFTIHFASQDYRYPDKLNYYYKLNNKEALWRKTETNSVSFANLQPGDYTFYVKAAYNVFDETPIATKTFTIKTPWYKTMMAYIIYGLLFAAVLSIIYYLKLKQEIANNKLKIAVDLDDFKTKFYTNIAHEFRTPLTLISGPIEKRLEAEELNDEDRSEFSMIQRNASRLLHLINQLLDLSKLKTNYLKLKIAQGDLSVFLKALAASFQYQATKQGIDYTVAVESIEHAWFDKDVIEKIVTNLLSNAFKYTPEHGHVLFKAARVNNQLQIIVENDGNQLTETQLSTIFNRFYQIDDQAEGVGLGLSLVKELVTLSKGTITVANTKANRIVFTVILPVLKTQFEDKDLFKTPVNADISKAIAPHEIPPLFVENKQAELPVLLIVEDNQDIRTFVKSAFVDAFQILEAEDGKIGVERAIETVPDIIISDVMMPKMDGFELTATLKQDDRTSHIPIILLTAKAEEASETLGLETGADDYITKPFKLKLLEVKVKNLMTLREKLRQRFSQELVLKPTDIAISNIDEKFLDKLKTVMDKNLTESSFSVEDFSSALNMSRMQLHRKLKALTSLSATEFIRSQRLKLAATLLENSDANVSEIGYTVGFNDPSYFTKCFKEAYGCSPSEYISKS